MASTYWRGFEDDEPIECEHCKALICAGDRYYEFDDEYFCSYECIGEYLVNKHEGDIKEKHLETAYEKEMVYADREYDRMRDEGWN